MFFIQRTPAKLSPRVTLNTCWSNYGCRATKSDMMSINSFGRSACTVLDRLVSQRRETRCSFELRTRTPVADILHHGQFQVGKKLFGQGQISIVDIGRGATLDEKCGFTEATVVFSRVGEISNIGDAPGDDAGGDPERIMVVTGLLDEVCKQELLERYILDLSVRVNHIGRPSVVRRTDSYFCNISVACFRFITLADSISFMADMYETNSRLIFPLLGAISRTASREIAGWPVRANAMATFPPLS
jgi:hypothetical protein